MRHIVILLFCVLLFSGCARSQPLSSAGSGERVYAAAMQRSASIRHEQSQQTTPGSPVLSLAQCVTTALENNPEHEAVRDDAAAAAARLSGAKADMWPKISATGGYTHYKDNVRLLQATALNEPPLYTKDVLSAEIALNLSIFSGGKTYNRILASDLLNLSAQSKLLFSREELVFNITSLYQAISAQKYVLAALDRSHPSLSEQAERIRNMMAAQKAAKVDLLRAEVRLAEVRQQRIAEQNAYTTMRLSLINMLGINISEESFVLADALLPPDDAPVPTPPPLEDILKKRQDYQAAQQSFEAQSRLVAAAQGEFWPEISVRGSYGHRRALGHDADSHGDRQGEIGSIGLMMEIPLFSGGSTVAKVREERAKLSAAQNRLTSLKNRVELEVSTAVLAMESARARIEAAGAGQRQAEESYRIERMKYDLGKGTIMDTLDAESALRQADTAYYRALADYHTAMAGLRLALGERI